MLFGRFSQPMLIANLNFNKAVSVFLPIVDTTAPLSGFTSSNAAESTETETFEEHLQLGRIMPGVRVAPRLDTSMTKSLKVGPLYSSSPVLVRFSSSFRTKTELSVEMAELLAMASHDPSTQANKFSFVIRLVAKVKANVTASGSPWIDKRRHDLIFELNCGCWNYLQVLRQLRLTTMMNVRNYSLFIRFPSNCRGQLVVESRI